MLEVSRVETRAGASRPRDCLLSSVCTARELSRSPFITRPRVSSHAPLARYWITSDVPLALVCLPVPATRRVCERFLRCPRFDLDARRMCSSGASMGTRQLAEQQRASEKMTTRAREERRQQRAPGRGPCLPFLPARSQRARLSFDRYPLPPPSNNTPPAMFESESAPITREDDDTLAMPVSPPSPAFAEEERLSEIDAPLLDENPLDQQEPSRPAADDEPATSAAVSLHDESFDDAPASSPFKPLGGNAAGADEEESLMDEKPPVEGADEDDHRDEEADEVKAATAPEKGDQTPAPIAAEPASLATEAQANGVTGSPVRATTAAPAGEKAAPTDEATAPKKKIGVVGSTVGATRRALDAKAAGESWDD